MGEVEAKVGKGTRNDLRHDRHTVSLRNDHFGKKKVAIKKDERGKIIKMDVYAQYCRYTEIK